MKIIEALKELPLIDKKLAKIAVQIQQYSSEADNGHMSLPFETPEKQAAEVDALVQSTNDLVTRSAHIRRALAMTNADIAVELGGKTRTISEWIAYRDRGFANQLRALQALNDSVARSNLKTAGFDEEKGIKIARFYDEKARNEKILAIEELQGQLDAKLEMVNATTDLFIDV